MVVDDGSTDATASVVASLGASRVRMVATAKPWHLSRESDGGRTARGEWIVMVDSDEELLPDAWLGSRD